MCSEVWYDKGGDGKLSPTCVSATEGTTHGLRCSCVECLAERQAIRRHGIGEMLAGPKKRRDRWADYEWDGPLANFGHHLGADDRGRVA